jgi:SNF family Na+-dependent transporter
MDSRSKLEVAGGIVLIFLGILFVIGFGFDPLDLITDTIFIVFGVVLVRGAYTRSAKESKSDSTRQGRRARRRKSADSLSE